MLKLLLSKRKLRCLNIKSPLLKLLEDQQQKTVSKSRSYIFNFEKNKKTKFYQ